jgi:pimeloyl-ACP methyl ester carboxylesterase
MFSRPVRPVRSLQSSTEQPSRGGRRRRGRRVAGIVALSMGGLLVASTSANLILEQAEKSASVPYGQRIQTSAGSINVTRTGDTGPTIVLLNGLGTPAPALDFAPLIRELAGYQLVTVEGFGYGYSDMTVRPRTIENISEELHEVLAKLEIKSPYTLMGHSLAGFSTLFYANKYPSEVSAVIGIDPTVPAGDAPMTGTDGSAGPSTSDYAWAHIPSTLGLIRWAAALGYGEPGGDNFTAAESQQMRQMTSWNFGSQAASDEAFRMGENAAKLRDLHYPATLPVLDFLSKDTMNEQADWFGAHERQLANVKRHELVVLDGAHYLHWTQSKAMAQKIRQFLSPVGAQ